MKIDEFKIGDFVTQIQSGDQSYTGYKHKIIELNKKYVWLKCYCKSNAGEIKKIDRKYYNDNWFKYIESNENPEALQDDIFGYGQLRLQHLFLGFELDRMRHNDDDHKFGDYLMICRIIEDKLGGRL